MYRNIYFDRKSSLIHLWTWNEDGERVYKTEVFSPYLYVPAKNAQKYNAIGIDDMFLEKKVFNTTWERKKFADAYKGKLYFNLPPTQQYLLEKFYNTDIDELTKFPLRTFFYDIEVIADEFPDPIAAKFPITSITIYDSLSKKFYAWGIKPYDEYSCKDHLKNIQPEEIVYEYCMTEKLLLKLFLKYWRGNFPDLVVGYNSDAFDMPYITNRLNQVFGEGYASKLSPVDVYYGVEKFDAKFGRKYTKYTFEGVSQLDYMILYKTFTAGERESDSLEFVCNGELGFGKLDYGDKSLTELCNDDWNKFINYNIWDVKLLILLDEHKKYLDVAKFTAYGGFCNIEKSLGKVAALTGWLAKQSLQKDRIISTQNNGVKKKIPGSYVKEPERGRVNDLIVEDIGSLYPNMIITLNISPESKYAKVISRDDKNIRIYFFKDKSKRDIPNAEFKKFIIDNKLALSASGVMFTQADQSICSKFVDMLYQKRKSVKKLMLSIENSISGMDINSSDYIIKKQHATRLDTEQYLYKILLNSLYGALANRFFPLYDLDCAKSITLTGQSLIKEADLIVNRYIKKEWDLDEKDRVIFSDTDSIGFTVSDILEKKQITMFNSSGDLTPEASELEVHLTEMLNKSIKEWAIDKLNTFDCRVEFKRESICSSGIWVRKKHYIMNIMNMEGIKTDYIKYKGVSVVKSSFSKETKTIIKNIVKGILDNSDKNKADKLYFDGFENFQSLPIDSIAVRSTLKSYDNWAHKANGMKVASRTPMNTKFSVYYNTLIKDSQLDKKYPAIKNGQKIKMVYVNANKYDIAGIAYNEQLPSELGLEVDRNKMFDTCVTNSLRPIYDALTWHVPNPQKQYCCSVEDIFG